jgi:phosphohistidine phosphatase SixA
VAPDGFHEHTDERIRGGVGEKDEIETERVTVSERYRARQTGEGPRNRFGG